MRAARLAALRGKRVALVEQAHMGGTCVNVGCVPKKLLHYAASYAHAFDEAPGYGWQLQGPVAFDWAHLRSARAQEIERLRGIYRRRLEEAGVRLVAGHARFVDPRTVEVDGQRFQARHIVIATGSRPRRPDLPGAERGVDSDAMFTLPAIPRQLVIVGGGYIACEMASIFQGLGAEVTLLERSGQLLKGFDTEAAHHLRAELSRQGIRVELDSKVGALRPADDGRTTVEWQDSHGQAHGTPADTVLLATGRQPNTEGLALPEAGIATDEKGRIPVDADLRTPAEGVYALGDVATAKPLTPVAIAEAQQLIDHLYGPAHRRSPRRVHDTYTPTAVFTHPSVGSIGYSEEKARQTFDAIDVYRSDFKGLKHALSGQAPSTLVKLVVDRASDQVVGLHIVSEDAAEIVQGFAVAMNAGATKADFDDTVGLHPTVAEELVSLREPSRQS